MKGNEGFWVESRTQMFAWKFVSEQNPVFLQGLLFCCPFFGWGEVNITV